MEGFIEVLQLKPRMRAVIGVFFVLLRREIDYRHREYGSQVGCIRG